MRRRIDAALAAAWPVPSAGPSAIRPGETAHEERLTAS